MEVTEDDVGKAITGLLHRIDLEYAEMNQADLEARWPFQFDPEKSIEINMYLFHDRLTLYGNSCRRWEEIHNGRTSVVERVRDKYLLPKIREFAETLRQEIQKSGDADAPRRS